MSLADILQQTRFSVVEINNLYDEMYDESTALTYAVEEAEELLESARNAVDDATDEEGHCPVTVLEKLNVAQRELDRAKFALSEWSNENTDEYDAVVRAVQQVSPFNSNTELLDAGSLEAYAMDYATDAGHTLDGWPYNCIDWERAAHDLSSDLTSVDIAGESFYVIGE